MEGNLQIQIWNYFASDCKMSFVSNIQYSFFYFWSLSLIFCLLFLLFNLVTFFLWSFSFLLSLCCSLLSLSVSVSLSVLHSRSNLIDESKIVLFLNPWSFLLFWSLQHPLIEGELSPTSLFTGDLSLSLSLNDVSPGLHISSFLVLFQSDLDWNSESHLLDLDLDDGRGCGKQWRSEIARRSTGWGMEMPKNRRGRKFWIETWRKT